MSRGFTLFEIILAMSIVLIVSALSYTGWQHLLIREQDKYLLKQVAHSLFVAEQAALNHGVKIAWRHDAERLSIFADMTNNGILEDDAWLVRRERLNLQHGKLQLRAYPHYRSYLQFSPHVIQQADNATIWYCRNQAPRWAIILSQSGTMQERLPDKQGQIKDGHGALLACVG